MCSSKRVGILFSPTNDRLDVLFSLQNCCFQHINPDFNHRTSEKVRLNYPPLYTDDQASFWSCPHIFIQLRLSPDAEPVVSVISGPALGCDLCRYSLPSLLPLPTLSPESFLLFGMTFVECQSQNTKVNPSFLGYKAVAKALFFPLLLFFLGVGPKSRRIRKYPFRCQSFLKRNSGLRIEIQGDLGKPL